MLATQAFGAAEIFVAPQGADANKGTRSAPLRTLSAARDRARMQAGKEPVTVIVADGVYYLAEPLTFTPADSGAPDTPVVYRSENEGGAVLSGGARLELRWTTYQDGILQASTPEGIAIDQLFVNGVRRHMARYPNHDATKTTSAYQGFAKDAFAKQRAAGWADPTGGYIHAMHRSRWGGYHYRITGKKPSGEVTYEGGWQNNRRMGMHEEHRMVENIFEELDAPGEWFHDATNRILYYMPIDGESPEESVVEVVRLPRVIDIRGSLEEPVHNITLEGFVVRHAARTFMQTDEPLLRSDWAIHRGGALLVTGGEDIIIRDMEFDQLGGNAIFFNNYNRRVRVQGCHIHDVGASGVCFVGDADAVRNPLFEYRQKNDLQRIDRTPGPQSENYPADGVVEDCLIHGIGRVERQPAGVQISMSRAIAVRDTSIYDCARAGINIGDGCWGGHLIERCDVFDTVLETHDHGSFNSWGRDRYWRSDRSVTQEAVDADPNLPFLDAAETTVIRNSRWRCDHGWDIDLDDGSSNYDIYNNLMLNGGLKLREGFRRRAWNNITVNNGFHPHVWFDQSQDEVFSNIFMAGHRGAQTPAENAQGKRIDANLFFVTDARTVDRYARFGWDVDSIVANPRFIDPSSGDFRVAEGSPAREVGFRNFPMDQFGVKKSSLRSIARTPEIPPLKPGDGHESRGRRRPKAADAEFFWLGAKLHGLKGEEYSAFGTRKADGGVALVEAPESSLAAAVGLKTNDLIQAVNGAATPGIAQFLGAVAESGPSPLLVQIVRDQQPVEVAVSPSVKIDFETSDNVDELAVPTTSSLSVTAAKATSNSPLRSLTDGNVADSYGPVFPNGENGGAYKINLGKVQDVKAIRAWSHNKHGRRGAQRLTLYGSTLSRDPGWNVADRERFTPIASVDTTRLPRSEFEMSGVAAGAGSSLGAFRWVVWRVYPVTNSEENTAFQELAVEIGK
ncbi:right-handed parallel beta-helix repeat-containing protein [Posidoniimonas corsicana]|uniref:right-handed parallel beta-helix repeat-containing protein n=1 Tax=Posidoniimonas corsicana TaxID=1938618 RepID=UPI001E3CE947|nr:signaling protein [Posidoniimonas corsicana]